MIHEPKSFAYSLSQADDGWRWSIYDEDGQTVARGADATRTAAQAAVEALLKRAGDRGAASAAA